MQRGIKFSFNKLREHSGYNILANVAPRIDLKMYPQYISGKFYQLFPIKSLEQLSSKINRFTGYDECLIMKENVKKLDQKLKDLKIQKSESRKLFTDAVEARSICQKELNTLLQNKPLWRDIDLQRFTELYREEINMEKTENEAKRRNEDLENLVETAHQEFLDALRERYQMEQLWSDHIRKLSSYGTFAVVIVNLLMFLLLQQYIEPRKRQQLLSDFKSEIRGDIAGINEYQNLINNHRKLKEFDNTPKVLAVGKKGTSYATRSEVSMILLLTTLTLIFIKDALI